MRFRWYLLFLLWSFRWWFLYRSLETGKDRTEQYGYFGCTQYFHCVSVQPFNTFFPGFWYARGLEPHVYYEASAVIIAFVLTGKLMEERAKGNTSTAIRKLMGMQPKVARVLRKWSRRGDSD